MDRNLEVIYGILNKNINEFLFKKILGDEISQGILAYYNEFFYDKLVDFALIIIDSLDSQILDNGDVLKVILKNLSDSSLGEIIKDYDAQRRLGCIDSFLNKNSLAKVKRSVIKELELDKNFFTNRNETRVSINNEIVAPFTPLEANYISKKYFLGLHDYQKKIKNQITKNLLSSSKSSNRFLVHMPTGSGKTKTCTEAIVDYIRVSNSTYQYDKKVVLWFAHSKELCEQGYDSLKETWQFKGDVPINFVKFFDDATLEDLQTIKDSPFSVIFIGFSKFHSFLKKNDYDSVEIKNFILERTQLVVVDEAHKALAATYFEMLNSVMLNSTKLIGLTATPGRGTLDYIGNQILTDFFHGNILRMVDSVGNEIKEPLKYLQNEHYLAEIDLHPIELTTKIEGKQSESQIASILSTNAVRNQFILNFIVDSFRKDESILVFANSINHCVILQALLKTVYHIDASYLTGTTSLKQREIIIKNFKNNSSKILINYGVLTTGFDAPNLNTLVIARPTKSIVLYSQMVGRALRGEKNGGNPYTQKNTVLTVKDTLEGYENPSLLFDYFNEFW